MKACVTKSLLAVALTLSAHVRADIQPGDSRDRVLYELGYANSRIEMGHVETLTYKSGIEVRLTNGVVEEVAKPGLVRLGSKIRYTAPGSALGARDETRLADSRSVKGKDSAIAKLARQKIKQESGSTNTTPSTGLAAATVKETQAQTSARSIILLGDDETSAALQAPDASQALGRSSTLVDQVRRLIMGLLLVFMVVALALYVFVSYCYKRICENAGEDAGPMIWVPLVQFIPLLRAAQMKEWMLLLFLIPVVNAVMILVLWVKICIALEKSPWLVLILFVPVLNFFFLPYLAFSKPPARLQPVELMGEKVWDLGTAPG